MNHKKKQTVEETPRIQIQDFRQHADYVRESGQSLEGELPFLGETLGLVLVRQDSVVELTMDETPIVLEPEASHLVPNTIAHWYFRCPECQRRCKALYRPTLEEAFACRECHDLTYRSSQEQHKNQALYATIGEDIGLDWEMVRDLCDMMAPGWDKK